jgi:hypothetical protein
VSPVFDGSCLSRWYILNRALNLTFASLSDAPKSKPKHLRASTRLLSLLWGRGPFCWGLGKLWFQGVEDEFRGEGARGSLMVCVIVWLGDV